MSDQLEALIYWAIALAIVVPIVFCFERVHKDDDDS